MLKYIRTVLALFCTPLAVTAEYWVLDSEAFPTFEDISVTGALQVHAYPGGRILVSTNYSTVNGERAKGWLVRINGDGTRDETFSLGTNSGELLHVYPDGRILYAYPPVSGSAVMEVRRSLPDGSDDPEFNPVTVDSGFLKIVVRLDGRIVLAGTFGTVNGQAFRHLVCLESNGTVAGDFQSPFLAELGMASINEVLALGDSGKILLVGSLGLGQGRNRVARLHSDGSVDASFSTGDLSFPSIPVKAYAEPDGGFLAVFANGSMLKLSNSGAHVAGFVATLAGSPERFGHRDSQGRTLYITQVGANRELRRMTTDYNDDATFPVMVGSGSPSSSYGFGLPVVTDDGAWFFGSLSSEREAAGLRVSRVIPGVGIDPGFNTRWSRDARVLAFRRLSNGGHLVGGRFDFVGGTAQPNAIDLVRVNEFGQLDQAFAASLPDGSSIASLWTQPDGKVLVVGSFPLPGGGSAAVIRLQGDGTADPAFSNILPPFSLHSVDTAGRIYGSAGAGLLRYLPDGVPDPSFELPVFDQTLSRFLPASDGTFYVGNPAGPAPGMSNQLIIEKFRADGTVDAAFEAARVSRFGWAGVLPDGRLVTLRIASGPPGTLTNTIVAERYAPDAKIDFVYSSRPYSGTHAPWQTQLDVIGVLYDLFLEGGGSGSQSFYANLTSMTPLGLLLEIGADGRVARGDAGLWGVFVGLVRTGNPGPSFDAVPFDLALSPLQLANRPLNMRVEIRSYPGGLGPVEYQWYKDGMALAGATRSTLVLEKLGVEDAGAYTVTFKNAFGEAISQPTLLSVDGTVSAPDISVHPLSRIVRKGESVTFTVTASGTPAPSFQWYFNGAPIPGANDGSYSVNDVQQGNVGTYFVQVSNFVQNSAGSFGFSVTSEIANLGITSGGDIPDGFDLNEYLDRYPEYRVQYASDLYGAWLHYRDVGVYDGEVHDDLFRPEEYLALYPELLAVLGPDLKKALLHWLAEGRIEGRLGRIPLEFDVAGYFERNPDVAAAMGGNAILGWQHFWNYGIYEGRAYDDEFRAFEYLALNEDLQAAFLNDWRGATLHWLRYGRIEGRLGRVPPIFDVTFYLTQYPDVAAVWGTYQSTVFLHYYFFGVYEARIFDNEFRVDDYIALNPDLQAVFGTDRRGAFMHWVRWGRSEGRPARITP